MPQKTMAFLKAEMQKWRPPRMVED